MDEVGAVLGKLLKSEDDGGVGGRGPRRRLGDLAAHLLVLFDGNAPRSRLLHRDTEPCIDELLGRLWSQGRALLSWLHLVTEPDGGRQGRLLEGDGVGELGDFVKNGVVDVRGHWTDHPGGLDAVLELHADGAREGKGDGAGHGGELGGDVGVLAESEVDEGGGELLASAVLVLDFEDVLHDNHILLVLAVLHLGRPKRAHHIDGGLASSRNLVIGEHSDPFEVSDGLVSGVGLEGLGVGLLHIFGRGLRVELVVGVARVPDGHGSLEVSHVLPLDLVLGLVVEAEGGNGAEGVAPAVVAVGTADDALALRHVVVLDVRSGVTVGVPLEGGGLALHINDVLPLRWVVDLGSRLGDVLSLELEQSVVGSGREHAIRCP
mmetsp:Transcript_14717/g.27718  ORF Transcript_14717/g.27718 Transcript_14717/m.27718 type:complete len:377 (-) Transcript_14717:604-1734(-)